MDPHKTTETPLTQQKVVRRGLLGGLATLGAAALLKASGTGKAEANNGDALVLGNQSTIGINGQSSTAGTRLVANTTSSGLEIVGGTTSPSFTIFGSTNGIADSAKTAIFGQADLGTGVLGNGGIVGGTSGVGVQGGHFGSSGFGVRGANAANGTGVKGVSNTGASTIPDGNGAGIGVHGKSNSGTGVVGESQNLFGVYGQSYGAGAGVEGIANAPGSFGVQGQSGSGVGVQGQSGANCGVRGLSNSFVGIVGISDNSIGLYGYNVSPNVPALYAENLGPNNRIAGLFNGDVQVHGNFSVSGGAKAAAVKMPDGSTAMMYSQESPEAYFEDFGRAQLIRGAARVQIEPEYGSLIDHVSYMVFLTPEGDCNGLYVSMRDAQGFEVRELKGGVSSLPFTYRIVSRRNDIPGTRLARMDTQAAANAAQARAATVGHGTGGTWPGSGGPGAGGAPVPSGPGAAPFAPNQGMPSLPPLGNTTPNSTVPGPAQPGPGFGGPGGPSGAR